MRQPGGRTPVSLGSRRHSAGLRAALPKPSRREPSAIGIRARPFRVLSSGGPRHRPCGSISARERLTRPGSRPRALRCRSIETRWSRQGCGFPMTWRQTPIHHRLLPASVVNLRAIFILLPRTFGFARSFVRAHQPLPQKTGQKGRKCRISCRGIYIWCIRTRHTQISAQDIGWSMTILSKYAHLFY